MTDKGRTWPAELVTSTDPVSGAKVRQWTHYKGHSSHFYFTNPCWFDDGNKMLYVSDRENQTNMYSVDLRDGAIVQLTHVGEGARGIGGLNVNAPMNQAIYSQGGTIMALDLSSLEETVLFTRPEGYVGGGTNVTADGKYVITGCFKDLSDQFQVDLGHGYVGFREIWEAHPHSMIYRVATDGSGAEKVFEKDYWMGHYNTSPVHAHLMTYCHEGPWTLVENRIWGLDLNTGETWQVRPNAPDEAIGHEYWMDDGEHIGYHGRTPNGPVYGSIMYDNSDQVEAPFTYGSMHFHSVMLERIVGDGGKTDPYLLLWRFRDGQFEGPKVLAWHRGSFHTQRVHVHPGFSPDGSYVVYTADPQGYGQVFTVDVPDWDALPDRSSI